MPLLDTIIDRIDRLAAGIGRIASWGVVAMVLVGAYNAVVRTLDREIGTDLSANTFLETSWYLFAIVFLLAVAWGVVEDRHVRVDIFFSRLSERSRARTNLAGTLLLLIPFCLFLLWAIALAALASWEVREASPDPGGLARWPIRAVPLFGVFLLLLAATSSMLKDVRTLRKERRADTGRTVATEVDDA